MNRQDSLIEAMMELDEEQVLSDVRAMVDEQYNYNTIQMCLNIGISCVGKFFEEGRYFIADLIVSGMIYRNALNIIMPLTTKHTPFPVGRIVIGVVEGDIHDIGKDILVSLLRSEGFEVIDLGIDVKPDRFSYAVSTYRPDVLLLSGALSLAKDSMAEVMDRLRKDNLRDQIKIMVGGMCSNEYLRERVGADSWACDTMTTIHFCKTVVEGKYGKDR